MKSDIKDNVFDKLIDLLARHQKFKKKHKDTASETLTEERWMEIDKQINRLNWLYGGNLMSSHEDLELVKYCCEIFSANPNDFKSKSRDREIVYARAFYTKHLFANGQSHDDIALKINRDRSNVYNVLKTADNLISTNKEIKKKYILLTEKFKVFSADEV